MIPCPYDFVNKIGKNHTYMCRNHVLYDFGMHQATSHKISVVECVETVSIWFWSWNVLRPHLYDFGHSMSWDHIHMILVIVYVETTSMIIECVERLHPYNFGRRICRDSICMIWVVEYVLDFICTCFISWCSLYYPFSMINKLFMFYYVC